MEDEVIFPSIENPKIIDDVFIKESGDKDIYEKMLRRVFKNRDTRDGLLENVQGLIPQLGSEIEQANKYVCRVLELLRSNDPNITTRIFADGFKGSYLRMKYIAKWVSLLCDETIVILDWLDCEECVEETKGVILKMAELEINAEDCAYQLEENYKNIRSNFTHYLYLFCIFEEMAPLMEIAGMCFEIRAGVNNFVDFYRTENYILNFFSFFEDNFEQVDLINQFSFDSYMKQMDDITSDDLRLLTADRYVILPTHTIIKVIVTSEDVIHS